MFAFRKLALTLAVMSTVAPVSGYALTMQQALESAYENNPSLNAARASQRATDERVPQALSGFLPSAEFRYDRQQLKTKRGGTESELYGDDESLSLTQSLFNGGSTVARTIGAKNQVLSGREVLRDSEQETLLQAVTAYNDVISAKATLDLSKSNQDVLKKRLDMTQERFNVGELTKTDVAQSQSRYASAVSSVAQAEAQYRSALSNFEEIVRIKAEGLEPVPVKLGKAPESLEQAIEIASSSNPGLRSARYLEKAAKNEVFASGGDILPDVNFVASRTTQDNTSSFLAGAITEKELGINVRVPLYQSGAEWSRLRQAKREAEFRKENVAAAKNRVLDDIVRSWESLKAAEATIDSNREAVRASELAVEGTQMEADLGTRTTMELLDTQQELFQTQVNLVRAERDANVAYYTLLSNMGALNAKELGLSVKEYDPKAYYNRVKFEIIGW